MRKYIKLDNHSNGEGVAKLKSFFSPDVVYIPLEDNFKIKLKDKKVLKGEFVSNKNYSYVSGNACGFKNCLTVSGVKRCLVIENDYKEQSKKIKKLTEEELNSYLESSLKLKLNSNETSLIFSIVEDEPYIYTFSMLVNNYFRDLLDTLEYLKVKFSYDNVYVVIKECEKKNIENLISTLGIYPFIKLVTVPNIYPILNTNYLFEVLNIKSGTILNPEEIYIINNVLQNKRVVTEKFLSIVGVNIKPVVVNVKLGSNVRDILKFLKIKYENYDIYLNGCISGKKIANLDDLIVTGDLRALVINEKLIENSSKCISCGLCFSSCPVGINPKYIYENHNISKEYLEKCIKCGLCNYVCPSHIDLKAVVEREDNNEN